MKQAPFFAPSNGEVGLTPRTKAMIEAAKQKTLNDRYWEDGGDYLNQWRVRK